MDSYDNPIFFRMLDVGSPCVLGGPDFFEGYFFEIVILAIFLAFSGSMVMLVRLMGFVCLKWDWLALIRAMALEKVL